MRGRKPDIRTAMAGDGVSRDVVASEIGTVRALEAPPGMSDTARWIWDVTVPDLAQAGVYRPSDAVMLRSYCEALANAWKAEEALQHEDPGSIEAKRLRASWNDFMTQATRIAAEFAISPIARLRAGLMNLKGASLLGALKDDLDEDA